MTRNHHLKQSFEKRCKRLGIATPNAANVQNNRNFVEFHNCKFWIWDQEEHKREYERALGRCCFNHLIGLPQKNDVPRPLFPYQKEIIDALDSPYHRLVAIAKARSIGASELCLRYMLWLCLRDDSMRNKNMAIVTGIREELSLELLRRFKNLLPNIEWNTKESLADSNGCRITAYPSKRVKDLRGATDIKFILCDEADHYDASDSEQLLPILEALLPKSEPKIVLVSTPGPIGSLMYKLYREPDHKCRYLRLYIPFTKAVGTMFTEEEIAKSKLQPNFDVEFALQWGSSGTGNVYSHESIERAIEIGKQFERLYQAPEVIDPITTKYIAVDEAFGYGESASASAVVFAEVKDNYLHVIDAAQYRNISPDELIWKIKDLATRICDYNSTFILVDGSNAGFVMSLKQELGESTNYQAEIANWRKKKLLGPNDEYITDFMRVIPINFSTSAIPLLQKSQQYLEAGAIAIHQDNIELIQALHGAFADSYRLDKVRSINNDITDAFRMLFQFLHITPASQRAITAEQDQLQFRLQSQRDNAERLKLEREIRDGGYYKKVNGVDFWIELDKDELYDRVLQLQEINKKLPGNIIKNV